MASVLTQCPVGCPPCGASCPPNLIPTPCTVALDPTLLEAPVYTGSIVLGSTNTPLTTPLPAGGSVTLTGAALIRGAGSVDSTCPTCFPPQLSCWTTGLTFGGGGPWPAPMTIPNAPLVGTYLQGTSSYTYDPSTGNGSSAFTFTVDASLGPNYTAWAATGFAAFSTRIFEFQPGLSCCCGWTTCGPAHFPGVSWNYMAQATYSWVFNPITMLYDATMTATAQKVCR